MNLKLTKPIVFFDLETTGINISYDRIVEISILKVSLDGSKISKTILINPEIPIPPSASKVHNIFDKDVQNAPKFVDVASEIKHLFQDSDVAGYNSNRFDVPLLMQEFERVGLEFDVTNRKFVDVQTIFHKKEPRTLEAALKFYCNKELIDAHSAEADTIATYEILLAQIEKYEDLENNIDFLSSFAQEKIKKLDIAGRVVLSEEGVAVFNFGKHKGLEVKKVFEQQPNYYNWLINADFPSNTKQIFTKIKLGQLK